MPFKIQKIRGQPKFKIPFNKWSEVEIPEAQIPEAKLKKWGDECFIKIRYPDFHPVSPIQHQGKLKWENTDKEVHLYPLEPREFEENGQIVKQLEQGGFEFEVILKKKPANNKIVLPIEIKGLKFYYQPPLTQEYHSGYSEEFQKEIIVSETQVKDLEGNVLVFRPENVIGSYAVYHKTQDKFFKTAEEGEKYKAGIVFHIYRPKITDAVGNWAWSEQEFIIDENGKGQQIITIPQDFLDNAVYPIRHAGGDTFGYEETGGSSFTIENQRHGSVFTCPESGTGISIAASIYPSITSFHWKYNIYLHDDLSQVVDGQTDEGTGTSGGPSFRTLNFTSPPSLSNTDYVLQAWSDLTGGTNFISYNAGDTNQGHWYPVTYGAWPDPLVIAHSNNKVSIYCTYTPTAAGTNMEINIADTWKDVDSIQINIGDVWKDVTKVEINIGDAWKTVFEP